MDVVSPGERYVTSTKISYLELLRTSIFTVCPPGDLWETYRFWEAIETGSFPIILHVKGFYGHCANPSLHLLHVARGVYSVQQWDELPSLIASEVRNLTALQLRQNWMLDWLDSVKYDIRSDLLALSRAMKARDTKAHIWRPRTKCSVIPSPPQEVAKQHQRLSKYWRHPQPESNREVQSYLAPEAARGFVKIRYSNTGRRLAPFCSGHSLNFEETCMSSKCGRPAVLGF